MAHDPAVKGPFKKLLETLHIFSPSLFPTEDRSQSIANSSENQILRDLREECSTNIESSSKCTLLSTNPSKTTTLNHVVQGNESANDKSEETVNTISDKKDCKDMRPIATSEFTLGGNYFYFIYVPLIVSSAVALIISLWMLNRESAISDKYGTYFARFQ
ncbi:541_t:CDS:2 [Acaulospora morrowiae]|uniref:541_t:CDS:1 n=1 Tax=Acaulospora morrowiae TaxID=94023 RepID=A0A9N9BYJ0_9GLOM|nr:541_t:CDS:2 [Acaulospora morrowiae]